MSIFTLKTALSCLSAVTALALAIPVANAQNNSGRAVPPDPIPIPEGTCVGTASAQMARPYGPDPLAEAHVFTNEIFSKCNLKDLPKEAHLAVGYQMPISFAYASYISCSQAPEQFQFGGNYNPVLQLYWSGAWPSTGTKNITEAQFTDGHTIVTEDGRVDAILTGQVYNGFQLGKKVTLQVPIWQPIPGESCKSNTLVYNLSGPTKISFHD